MENVLNVDRRFASSSYHKAKTQPALKWVTESEMLSDECVMLNLPFIIEHSTFSDHTPRPAPSNSGLLPGRILFSVERYSPVRPWSIRPTSISLSRCIRSR